MSSFVNDNVSESKNQQQQQHQQQREQTTEKVEDNFIQTQTNHTNTKEPTTTTTTICSYNDNSEVKKHNETNEKTTKANENENTSEKQRENATINNYDADKSNNEQQSLVVFSIAADVKDTNLNTTNEKSLLGTTIKALELAGGCSTCCDPIIAIGEAEQQVASFENNQSFEPTATSELLSTTIRTTANTTSCIDSTCNETPRRNNTLIKLQALTTSSPYANDGSVSNATSSSSTSSPSTPTTVASPLPPLPAGFASTIAGYHHLPHICSEPTFSAERQLNPQHQKNNCSSGNSRRAWRADTSAHNFSSVIKSGTVSASASPSMVRKTSDATALLSRRVSFPKSDNELVTGYLEPANPWEHVYMVKSISEIAELYMTSCQKHNTKPLQCILDHLKVVDLTKQLIRQPLLSLKSIKLAPSDCEALEEVLKRVQYKAIDISDCKLDEAAASALFEMIEYYEATNELDISSNAMGMTYRGWISCTYMISHSQELQVLNAEGNPISKLSADHLGNALSTSNLHTLKLEHCGLKGAPLSGLCYKLWHNKVLKELWLAHNDLDCSDADTISEMLKVNHFLELIDISNNNIRDEGLRNIVMALIMQSKELERRTTFQRTAAIDDDGDSMSPVEISPPVELGGNGGKDGVPVDWSARDESHESQLMKSVSKNEVVDHESILCKKDAPLETIEEKTKGLGRVTGSGGDCGQQLKVASVKPPLISSVGSTIDENDGDEDTEETVRSSTIKNSTQNSGGGQSMLDKLLSMNSESSSEDGASNLSTDTLAACCSEDASLVSDDIFDASSTTTSTNIKAPTCTQLEVTSLNERGVTVTSVILNSVTTTTSTGVTEILQNSPSKNELIDNKVTNDVKTTNLVLIETPAESTSMCIATTNIQSPHVNNIINNNNNNNNNNTPPHIYMPLSAAQNESSPSFSNNADDAQKLPLLQQTSGVFEVTAEESDCLLRGVGRAVVGGDGSDMRNVDHSNVITHHAASRAVDVNKNTKLAEDFDDTHSTDSAFESASEGDISRHLPEEFTRLSTSLESTRLDEIGKEMAIETATIASESNECLIAAAAVITPSSTPTPPTPPFSKLSTPLIERECLVGAESSASLQSCLSTSLPSLATSNTPPTVQVVFAVLEEPTESPIAPVNDIRDKMPKVTIAQDSFTQKYKSTSSINTSPSPTPTPPPPSTSPGGASSGLRRTESSCAFLTQSTRNRSQSTDSLCSDNSLDGSIGSGDLNFSSSSQLNEIISKNDTLTRQQRQLDHNHEIGTRTPGGLKALAVWNNNLTKEAGLYISELLAESVSMELLNIGKNCLSNEFISTIRESLTRNTTVTTLGLQSAHLSAKGIETLSSILTFGGNSTLQRIDIRDNKLEVESLTKMSEVLKSNTTVTQIDIDDEPKRLSVGSEAHLDYARVLENVRSMCSRNEKTQAQIQQEKSTANAMANRRAGYYLGSRKISLTCHSRPVVDVSKNVVVAVPNSKLDIKRKAGTRLRSPVPSPTTISPSSSPNRGSRFQVYRVAEVSSLTSSCTQKQIGGLGTTKAVSSSSVSIPCSALSDGGEVGNDTSFYPSFTSTSLPTSCSLPSMATVSSSTQSIKRLSVSPRSRFLVRKVYEDPNLPLSSCSIPPITPPINPPPTPISKNLVIANLEATTPPSNTTQHPLKSGPDNDEYLFSSSTNRQKTIGNLSETPETVVITPTIIQHNNATTEITTTTATTTPILNIKETSSTIATILHEQQSEQSTNNTTTNRKIGNNLINLTTATTTISTSCSNLQSSPTILSTLSTLSSSPSASESSSSSSSSTSPASNADSTDSSSSPSSASSSSNHPSEALCQPHHDLTYPGQCPVIVYSDNDITLTKNTVSEVYAQAAATTVASASNEGCDVDRIEEELLDEESSLVISSDENMPQTTALQQQHQRVRKVSWKANTTAVDKLLTLFHNPTTIFQRSSSPESKASTLTAVNQLSQSPPSYLADGSSAIQQQKQMAQTNLVPMRKVSPPSWTKLGSDIIQAAGSNNSDLANAVATTAAAVVTEQSRSFLDAASKQFRDFSKQVFRQNLSFGNEPATTTATTSTAMITAVSGLNEPQTTGGESGGTMMGTVGEEYCPAVGCCGNKVGGSTGCTCDLLSSFIEYDANCIPTVIKQEIKENISPEHTINEETLHTIQKLYGNTTIGSAAVAGISDFKDNDDFMDLRDFSTSITATTSTMTTPLTSLTPLTALTPQKQQHQPPSQAASTLTSSGIENDPTAHNT